MFLSHAEPVTVEVPIRCSPAVLRANRFRHPRLRRRLRVRRGAVPLRGPGKRSGRVRAGAACSSDPRTSTRTPRSTPRSRSGRTVWRGRRSAASTRPTPTIATPPNGWQSFERPVLALESELAPRRWDVLTDFNKLLCARADLRVMVVGPRCARGRPAPPWSPGCATLSERRGVVAAQRLGRGRASSTASIPTQHRRPYLGATHRNPMASATAAVAWSASVAPHRTNGP